MPSILVVEDSPEQARMIASLLEAAGFEVEIAPDGVEALRLSAARIPDLVVTDLIMPNMNGLELVKALKQTYPRMPVILMTAFGNDEIALRALERGASSYVPKRHMRQELVSTAQNVLAVAQAEREQVEVLDRMVSSEATLVLENDQNLIAPLVRHIQELLSLRWAESDEGDIVQIGVAIQEALLNAMHHGNLEVDSELRETSPDAYQRLIEQRRHMEKFRARRIDVTFRLTRKELKVVVGDEGRGFDPDAVGNPTDPANLERVSGRGLYLICTFMDDVKHNALGNEITMLKQREETHDRG